MAEDQKTPAYSKGLTNKYEIIDKSLRPAKVTFGYDCGHMEIDLTKDICVKQVDKLVKMYPNQKYFRLKSQSDTGSSSRTSSPGAAKVPAETDFGRN